MLGNFPMERYFPTCLTFWTRGSILINYKVRLRLPREELICDWIKAAQLYIHQQDPELILTTPTISRKLGKSSSNTSNTPSDLTIISDFG